MCIDLERRAQTMAGLTYIRTHTHTHIYIYIYTHTYIHTYSTAHRIAQQPCSYDPWPLSMAAWISGAQTVLASRRRSLSDLRVDAVMLHLGRFDGIGIPSLNSAHEPHIILET